MGIDLTNGYNDLKGHIGHKIVCQPYGDPRDPVNIAIECETCNCILIDFNQPQKAPSIKTITEGDLSYFETKIDNWKEDNKKDKKMVEAYTKDRKELRIILGFVKKGKYKEAGEHAYFLDTVVRDVIPSKIYNIIIDAYEYC